MILISAIFLSLLAGVLLALPALVAEVGAPPKNVPLLLDIKTFWGKKLNPREVFLFGLLIHLGTAAAFGLVYQALVIFEYVKPYHFGGLIAYATCFYVVVGAIIFPLVRLGLFGRKLGRWVWFELLVVHHLLALFIWALVRLFPVLTP